MTAAEATVPLTNQSVTFANINRIITDSITIVEAGTYRIDIFVSGNTSVADSVTVSLGLNAVPSPDMTQTLELIAGTTATFALTNYFSLAAGDELTILMSADTEATFFFPPTGRGATLSVLQIA
ncbi:hypothetical protein [Clostridium sp. Marseille-P2415]|uniref:hypothetical protein n=1 Tax=Clostridium sp. Marseille-P2415 TaxID=1805471 RepID=UPI001115A752|nr:hypothetical protein [Clostridium sp. Marseille-P2415]